MTLDLAQLREGWDFEAKLAGGRDGRGAVPASFFETYSAMANTDGGTVVLGVQERTDKSLEVRGLADIDKVEQELWDLLDNRNKVSANILQRADVQRLRADGADVLVIQVPRADRRLRPVYLNGNPLVAFRRSGEGDRRCNELQVRRMIADASDEPRDGTVLVNYGLDDIDGDTLDAWRNVFRAHERNHPFLTGDDTALLTGLGGMQRDRETGKVWLTIAGLLMFGKERSILNYFPRYHLDYREMTGNDPAERWQDRVTLDGKWPGNVYSFFRRVIHKLTADLKVPFRLNANLERVDDTPAHDALREALVNALIHADYTGARGIRVFKRRTSFELINPGTLRVPWEAAREGNASDPRNPTLQKMFQLVGLGDRAGSGVPRILQAWHAQHWRVPELTEDFGADETHLVLSTESLLPPDVVEALYAAFGSRFEALPELKRTALVTAAAEGRISNRRLREVMDRHPRDITFLLIDLVREGFLEPHGEGGGRTYTLRIHGGATQPTLFDLVGEEPPSSDHSGASSAQSSAHRSMAAVQPVEIIANGLEQSLEQSLEQGLLPPLGAKVSTATLRTAIVTACANDFLTLAALARRLGRQAASLRRAVHDLLRDGSLELRYPNQPRHPQQAYRATPKAPR